MNVFAPASGHHPSIVKGHDWIEEIVTRYEERVRVEINTRQCGRMLRRDFYLMTRKMFKLSFQTTKRDRIHSRLDDIRHELVQLRTKNDAPSFSPTILSPIANVVLQADIRLISVEARALFDMLVELDRMLSGMHARYSIDEATSRCSHVFEAYGRLKRTLFQVREAVTVHETR